MGWQKDLEGELNGDRVQDKVGIISLVCFYSLQSWPGVPSLSNLSLIAPLLPQVKDASMTFLSCPCISETEVRTAKVCCANVANVEMDDSTQVRNRGKGERTKGGRHWLPSFLVPAWRTSPSSLCC